MIVYKVEECDYGSYEPSNEIYFKTLKKAKQYAKQKGHYQQNSAYGLKFTSPFTYKTLLPCGDFLLDITDTWNESDRYLDEDLWSLDSDYIAIYKIKVL